MPILNEILEIFIYSFSSLINTIIQVLYENLPVIYNIHRTISTLTPIGMFALYFGVPTFIIYGLIFIVKKIIKLR